jgi:arylsulfatase A-like enzyme
MIIDRKRLACIMGRNLLGCLVTLCLLILCGCKAQTKEQTPATPINRVILISIDCLRPDYLGVYNPQMKTSPHINRLAQESIVGLNATSQASTTAPSHKSILYSLYPGIHKSSMYSVPEEKLKNPLQILQSKGFTTAAFVGGGQISHAFGFGRGFHSYWEPKGKQKFRFNRTERMAVEWLEQNFQKKFFLFLHTYEVHCPFAPPDKYFQKFSSWYKGKVKSGKCSHDYYNLLKLTGEDEKFVRSLYAAEVNYVDDCLGRIFKKLKDLGIYDQTIIIVLGDHGESLGERGYYGHNQLYNIQLQIPLIIKIPNGPKTRIEVPVEAIDIMPTVFAALGLGRPFPFQGKNLLAAARNQMAIEPSRPVISEQVEQYRIRIGNQTAIFPRGKTGEEEFYDISKDPEEKTNLILENRETARQFKLIYERMLQQNQNIASQFVKTTTAQPQMDEETREQLKALGYIVN